MKWNITCDSSCDILTLPDLARDTVFSIAPLKIIVGDREFVDDETLDRQRMLDAMSSFKGASSSACPAPFEWARQFEKADLSIAVCISSQLSGSYNSAMVAKDMVLEKFPSKKIHVVNSRSTSGSMILLAEKINSLIKAGKDFEQVVNEIEQYNNTMQLTFCLTNYDNLIKTGRMSAFTGAVASVLGIRAIAMKSPLGEINVLSKQRGDANTYKYIVNQMSGLKELKNLHIIITHCQNADGAHKIKNLLKDMYGAANVSILETRGLCSFYANTGGIIVSY